LRQCHIADASNQWFWRANRQRLDAETARDLILLAAGKLDLGSPPHGSQLNEPASAAAVAVPKVRGRTNQPFSAREFPYRSVFLPAVRLNLPDSLDLFDAPDGNQTTGKRELTTVAPQALFLRNSPWVMEQSASLSRSTLLAAHDDDERIRLAYQRVLLRDPSDDEVADARSSVQQLRQLLSPPDEAWVAFHQSLLSAAEFWLVD